MRVLFLDATLWNGLSQHTTPGFCLVMIFAVIFFRDSHFYEKGGSGALTGEKLKKYIN